MAVFHLAVTVSLFTLAHAHIVTAYFIGQNRAITRAISAYEVFLWSRLKRLKHWDQRQQHTRNGTLHEFNKVQIIQNVPKPSRLTLQAWKAAVAVSRLPCTSTGRCVQSIHGEANYTQQLWSTEAQSKRHPHETGPRFSSFFLTSSYLHIFKVHVVSSMWQFRWIHCRDHTLLCNSLLNI